MPAVEDTIIDRALNAAVTYADVSRAINALITTRDGELAGIPMPLPGLRLEVEAQHPWKDRIAALQAIVDSGQAAPTPEAIDPINSWYSHAKHGTVHLYRDATGHVVWGIDYDAPRRNRLWFGPFDAMDAWSLDAEVAAMERLKTLISERMYRAYVLTGGFIETSAKSDLTYWFRRLRPTLVVTTHGSALLPGTTTSRILVALCLHPIAFYQDTFCGGLCPTDDVIAHLLMCRADEHLLWKRANHHEAHSVLAGL